jgi:hypothetical protein
VTCSEIGGFIHIFERARRLVASLPWLKPRGALSLSDSPIGERGGPLDYHTLITIGRQQSFRLF